MAERSAQSRKAYAYEYIRDQILTGGLMPGDIVNEKQYMQELEVSRTPVREALIQLAEEGLIEIMPRRGMVVTYISVGDVKALYDARLLIEPYLIEQSIGQLDPSRLQEYQEKFSGQQNPMESAQLDSEFHLYIASCSGNSVLYKMEQSLMAQTQRIRFLSSENASEKAERAAKEHTKLIKHLLNKDAAKASALEKKHLKTAMDGYFGMFTDKKFFTV